MAAAQPMGLHIELPVFPGCHSVTQVRSETPYPTSARLSGQTPQAARSGAGRQRTDLHGGRSSQPAWRASPRNLKVWLPVVRLIMEKDLP